MLALLFISTNPLSLVYPNRYEDEINRRTGAENEFVVLKKVSELGATGRSMKLPWHAPSSSKADGSWGSSSLAVGSGYDVGTSGSWYGPGLPEATTEPMELPCFLEMFSGDIFWKWLLWLPLEAIWPLAPQFNSASGHVPGSQSFTFCPRTWFWLMENVHHYVRNTKTP